MWILCSANTTRPFEKYLSNCEVHCEDRSELEAHQGEQTQGKVLMEADANVIYISDREEEVVMLIFYYLTILKIVTIIRVLTKNQY